VFSNSGRAHMGVATAEGEERAEIAAEESLHSPLLDHNLISGAKNILLNISVSNADELIYQEVTKILGLIQAHASVRDENGVICDANIIWGTSTKPELGNAIELIVIATGFESDIAPSTSSMQRFISPAKTIAPVEAASNSVLEPIKPTVKPIATQRPLSDQVVLGAKTSRYTDIQQILGVPAYKARNAKMVIDKPRGRKEVLTDETKENEPAEEATNASLFD
ncbi:MAG: cell division protein FtsZ, partial [Alistipes sp.]